MMTNGAIAPPMEEPLSNNAVARARSRFGNHSETALVAAGQLADSPRPSRKRNPAKLFQPVASEVSIETTEYQKTGDGPKGNIGYPARLHEIDHFIAVLKQTARRIEPAQFDGIEAALRQARTDLGLDRGP